MTDVVQKLWGFCHTLRHDGIDYGDYIEQITYLLFLKMAEEKAIEMPNGWNWSSLKEKSGTELLDYYVDVLRGLGKEPGMLGDIFSGAVSRFSNPVNLKKLINLVDETEWTSLETDVKADAYEGLLEKAASEGKKGAGQYFTPRLLIKSIVRCMKPDPRIHKDFTICDPACGTGGFLVGAYEWLMVETGEALDRADAKRIKNKTYFGTELVPRPRRLALMNLYLHGLNANIYLGDSIYEPNPGNSFDCILTNPPFGTKGANQAPVRDEFMIETSDKQLNFVQHVVSILKPGGRAAVVLPDNCLFSGQAGKVFELLMKDCDLHTILRLTNGTFTPYSPGTKTNVVFFTKGRPTEKTWIYDARTNVPSITKNERPLTPEHYSDFEKCYGNDPNGSSNRKETRKWKLYTIEEIKERNYNLDITWIKDESLQDVSDLPEPKILAGEAISNLEEAMNGLQKVVQLLESNGNSEETEE
jgi:type I restriction enzyme M protein